MIEFSLKKKLHNTHGDMYMNVSCSIETGAFIGLYGFSGAGKTSLLRMLSGFMKPDEGVIKMNNEVWFDSEKKIDIASQKRKIGFVFQDYALFPNMNVNENIAFALSKNNDEKIVDELLEIIELTGLRYKKIYQLSGGQQQRVALARALVQKPTLLLLDEPLAAIDNEMRMKLQQTLLKIHAQYNTTAILVSHDVNEILKLTSKMIHLENGIIKQFEHPLKIFVEEKIDPLSLIGTFISFENINEKKIVSILIGSQILKIQTQENECESLQKGDEIMLSFKDANPLIRKL